MNIEIENKTRGNYKRQNRKTERQKEETKK